MTAPTYPYTPAPGSTGWGVRDNIRGDWVVSASHDENTAVQLATAMTFAYAARSADTVIKEAAR